MLYGNCKKILKSIVFLCAETSETNTLDIAVFLNNRIQTEDMIGCLRHLASAGERYINITKEEGPLLYVSPTHKGKHFKEDARAEAKHFLMVSVLVPIIVSAATTLITLWITSFFK